jgi:hypothetical protein
MLYRTRFESTGCPTTESYREAENPVAAARNLARSWHTGAVISMTQTLGGQMRATARVGRQVASIVVYLPNSEA